MLSKEMYEKLNKKIYIDKDLIPSYEQILQYYNEMNDISNKPEIKEDCEEDLIDIIELYCLYYGIMSIATMSKPEGEKIREKSLFSSIFSNIANSVLSIKNLANKGLDYQANVIIRQLFEMSMILLNVGIDKEKADILISTEMTEENMKIWRKYFSPKALNKTIEAFEGDFLSDWRKREYSWYSNYAHNEFLSFFAFSFAKPQQENEILISNIWGGYVSRVNVILKNMMFILWYTSKAFMKIIVSENTYVTKELIADERDLWNFAGYIFHITDMYVEQYINEHKEELFS